MKFRDIKQFPQAYYQVHVDLSYLEDCLTSWDRPDTGNPLILEPEWQRGHVWTKTQQISFMEYFFRGGVTGRDIYFNCSSWQASYNTPTYCLDGLQRLTAALSFVRNKIKVYGAYFKDYEDTPRMTNGRFSFNMLALANKRELLETYIMFNSGGVVHKPKEIARIREMQANTPEDETV